MELFIHTFHEEIHILDRCALGLLHCCPPGGIIIRPVVVVPQIVKIDEAALPPSLCASPAGLPPTAAPPSCWRRRCRLWTEEDLPDHGGVHRRPDALPVLTGLARAQVVAGD